MAVGVGAFGYQFANGLVVTGMRNIVMWGQYILFFMFFVGLSAGGLIVASAGRLFGVKAFKPITRLAVLEATVAVILAATFILPDLGRPERVLNIPLYFNPTSPMVWDITIVMVYMGLSATYVWLYARADLARRGSWLALGTGTSKRTMAREERAKTRHGLDRAARRRSCCTPSRPGSSGSRSAAGSGTARSWRRCSSRPRWSPGWAW